MFLIYLIVFWGALCYELLDYGDSNNPSAMALIFPTAKVSLLRLFLLISKDPVVNLPAKI